MNIKKVTISARYTHIQMPVEHNICKSEHKHNLQLKALVELVLLKLICLVLVHKLADVVTSFFQYGFVMKAIW